MPPRSTFYAGDEFPNTYTDNAIPSFQWTTVDIFFAITAASLPVLNAAIPKSWRGKSSHGTPQLNYIPNNSSSGDSKAPPRSESESTINQPGNPGLAFHSEDILREDEKDRKPSVVQLPAYNSVPQLPHSLATNKQSYTPYPQATSDTHLAGRRPHDDIV